VPDKRLSIDAAVSRIESGMTVGIGGWGSRRKPMALVRALAASGVRDLTLVSYGGPDVGLLVAAGVVKRLVSGFVSLDSIPLEPHFRLARQAGKLEFTELDEGMLQWGLLAAAHRLPFLPTRAGLGSDVPVFDSALRTVVSPYPGPDGGPPEELLAMPAIELDVALVHMNRADARGNGQVLGPDPFFDDLFLQAAKDRIMSAERIVPAADLLRSAPVQSLVVNRLMVDVVVETPHGAHFTACLPDYGRDEKFQRVYAAAALDPDAWKEFHQRFLAGDEESYQRAVAEFAAENAEQDGSEAA
jgi:glutaconate CoA-transferase subunit A